MMRLSPTILALALFGSALVGWLVKPGLTESKKSAQAASTLSHQQSGQQKSGSPIPPALARQIESVSFDLNLEELVEKHRVGRLTELALWLADADSNEMAEAWRAFHAKNELDPTSYDLFMKHWTKIDPRGALAIARETGHERTAWWAWGRNDPEKAFAACQLDSPQHLAVTHAWNRANQPRTCPTSLGGEPSVIQ